jgi:hypothetical protein
MKTIIVPSIVLAAATTLTLAAKPADEEQRQPRHPPSPVIMALDANHDGMLSAGEIAGAAQALCTLDTNGDGKIDQEEIRPPRPGHAPAAASPETFAGPGNPTAVVVFPGSGP